MSTTLLKTKLYIPPAPPKLVARPHLIRQLNGGRHKKLSLVSAPPGFGKTTLLSAWVHQHDQLEGQPKGYHSHTGVAWVSLDEHDNDPVRFWSYVVTALNNTEPGVGSEAIELLNEPQPPAIEDILTPVINAIAEIASDLLLILDDYHVVETEVIHQALSFFVDHLPPHMHLAIASRTDPPLPLTRLRVSGQLTELRDRNLRFTVSEAALFLSQSMDIDLSISEINALETRTEGWIAGLQLAALSMQGRSDTHDFVQAFTGSHRYVIDYLAEEVLQQQPAHIRAFLTRTAILNRMCSSLCDALLSVEFDAAETEVDPLAAVVSLPSQEILEYLEQSHLFLIPLDDERRWYRYHHLFADFLREYLGQNSSEAQIKALHRQASRWFAEKGSISEAVEHALAAGDVTEATNLIEKIVINVLTGGEVATVQNWLSALPEANVRARPRLSLTKGWALVIVNRWDQVEPYLEAAEQQLEQDVVTEDIDPDLVHGMRMEAIAMRAMLASVQGHAKQAIALCESALAQLPADNTMVRGIITMTLGMAYSEVGEIEKAQSALTETVTIGQSGENLVTTMVALSNLANLQKEQSNLHQAAELYRQGMKIVKQRAEAQGRPFAAARWVYVELAELYREWNDLNEASRYLTLGLEMNRQLNMLGSNLPVAHIVSARVLQAQGDISGALDALQEAKESISAISPVATWIDALQAKCWLEQGNLSAAVHWADMCDLPLDEDFNYLHLPGEYAVLVRVYLAQERFEEALALLQRMQAVEQAGNGQRTARVIELYILEALLLNAQGEEELALAPLVKALRLSEKGGYIRIYVDEGRPMARLLRQIHTRSLAASEAYLNTILAAFGDGFAQPAGAAVRPSAAAPAQEMLIEPLSERELEVLQLVADGLSNREIAEKLYITVGTAKTHTINIYRKLNVRSRTQAVALGQELGIL